MEALGERIRELRTRRNWTLRDLSERTGVSVQMLSFIERGDKAGSIQTLGKIAEAFSISPGLLQDLDVEMDRLVEISEILDGLQHLRPEQVEIVRSLVRSLRSV